jgi:hypothetical protein
MTQPIANLQKDLLPRSFASLLCIRIKNITIAHILRFRRLYDGCKAVWTDEDTVRTPFWPSGIVLYSIVTYHRHWQQNNGYSDS